MRKISKEDGIDYWKKVYQYLCLNYWMEQAVTERIQNPPEKVREDEKIID